MKKIILFSVLVVSVYFSFGQANKANNIKGKFSFGIGPAVSFPVGDLKDTYKYGAGADLIGTYGLGNSVQGFVQTGLQVFKTTGFYATYNDNDLHIPVLLGARYINNRFFTGAGIGYGKWTGNFENNTGLAFSPQAGYAFKNVQVQVYYTGVVVSGGVLGYAGVKVFRVF